MNQIRGGLACVAVKAPAFGAPCKDYEIEAVSSPSGVTHVTFTRAGA